MQRIRRTRAASAALLAAVLASPVAAPSGRAEDPAEDARQLVEMPAPAQQLLRQDMRDHLAVLNQILGLLAASRYAEAAALAERRLGTGSMGRHRGTGMGPGRFMPPAMHRIAMAMHQAASEFATIAAEGDPARATAALQRVTSACVACHAGFRIR